MVRRNLILIHRGPEYDEDFTAIAERVSGLNPTIHVFTLPGSLKVSLPHDDWMFPTLTVSLQPEFELPIRRGPVLRNMMIEKLRQQEIFRKHGIPTPPAVPFRFGMALDPLLFGDFVVLKPADLRITSHGEGVYLFRRKRLAMMRPEHFPPGHPMTEPGADYIVQRFIDTGPSPCHTRVSTLFGELLFSFHLTLDAPRPPLDAPDADLDRAVIASQSGPRSYSLRPDPEVFALARRVHAALPHIPILGTDIVRDQRSGQLYVLECNPGGNTWHFSSGMAQYARGRMGGAPDVPAGEAERRGRLALINQFGAFDRAAEVLVEKTLELAE